MTRRPVAALAASLPALPEPRSLAGRLLAVLRPPFTAEVIVPDVADAMLAGRRCTVTGCGRRRQGRGLCGTITRGGTRPGGRIWRSSPPQPDR
jgi:hypothetical protein